ncbi:hypothetical protein, partial [Klebsiella pneumoniae]|uniref:hypothetical protein n=1 Tax=Klebsiella pneumoniae TaxID=573 RepID=UPI00254E76D7
KKLIIACAIVAEPAGFEDGWAGEREWHIPGAGTFKANPRHLIDDELFDLIRTYRLCDRGMAGHVWPDGGALLDQPNVLVEAFAAIGSALAAAKERR